MSEHCPLPRWTVLGYAGPWEATAPDGTAWRLWRVDAPSPVDPHPAGYRLAPRDAPGSAEFVTGDGGLYLACDIAGKRILAAAARKRASGSRTGLEPPPAP